MVDRRSARYGWEMTATTAPRVLLGRAPLPDTGSDQGSTGRLRISQTSGTATAAVTAIR